MFLTEDVRRVSDSPLLMMEEILTPLEPNLESFCPDVLLQESLMLDQFPPPPADEDLLCSLEPSSGSQPGDRRTSVIIQPNRILCGVSTVSPAEI